MVTDIKLRFIDTIKKVTDENDVRNGIVKLLRLSYLQNPFKGFIYPKRKSHVTDTILDILKSNYNIDISLYKNSLEQIKPFIKDLLLNNNCELESIIKKDISTLINQLYILLNHEIKLNYNQQDINNILIYEKINNVGYSKKGFNIIGCDNFLSQSALNKFMRNEDLSYKFSTKKNPDKLRWLKLYHPELIEEYIPYLIDIGLNSEEISSTLTSLINKTFINNLIKSRSKTRYKNNHVDLDSDDIVRKLREKYCIKLKSHCIDMETLIQSIIDINTLDLIYGDIKYLDDDSSTLVEGYREGKIKIVEHTSRERNIKVKLDAIKNFKRFHSNKLYCEVCEFDFLSTYGAIGEGYIEGHHKVPLHELKDEAETKAEDILLVCSNCHSMLHKRRPPYTKEDLKKFIESQKYHKQES